MTEIFSQQIDEFVKKAEGNLDKVLREFSMELVEKVMERTPYKTGHARASWWAALNDPAGVSSGSTTAAAATLALAGAKWGDVVYINNNAAYINALEYGHSKQAPNGMVRITLAQAGQMLERIATKIGRAT